MSIRAIVNGEVVEIEYGDTDLFLTHEKYLERASDERTEAKEHALYVKGISSMAGGYRSQWGIDVECFCGAGQQEGEANLETLPAVWTWYANHLRQTGHPEAAVAADGEAVVAGLAQGSVS